MDVIDPSQPPEDPFVFKGSSADLQKKLNPQKTGDKVVQVTPQMILDAIRFTLQNPDTRSQLILDVIRLARQDPDFQSQLATLIREALNGGPGSGL